MISLFVFAIGIFTLLHTLCTTPCTGAAIFFFSDLSTIITSHYVLSSILAYMHKTYMHTPSLSLPLPFYFKEMIPKMEELWSWKLKPKNCYSGPKGQIDFNLRNMNLTALAIL